MAAASQRAPLVGSWLERLSVVIFVIRGDLVSWEGGFVVAYILHGVGVISMTEKMRD